MKLAFFGFEILLFVICIILAILCIFGGICVLKLAIDFVKGKCN